MRTFHNVRGKHYWTASIRWSLAAVAQSTPTGTGLSFEGFIIEGSIPPAPEPFAN